MISLGAAKAHSQFGCMYVTDPRCPCELGRFFGLFQHMGQFHPLTDSVCYSNVVVNLGSVAEWTKATDCKSVGVSLRWFESTRYHSVCDSREGALGRNKPIAFEVLTPVSRREGVSIWQSPTLKSNAGANPYVALR